MAIQRNALLIAAVLLVDVAQVGAFRHEHDPVVREERDLFGKCMWPFDPLDLGPRKFAPKGGILMGDDKTMLALVLFFTLGFGAMYTDFLQLAEDEELQEDSKVAPKAKDSSTSTSKRSWPMLPTTLAIIIISLVASSSISSIDPSPVPCQRLPVLAPSRATLLALSDDAAEELLRVRGTGQQPPTLAGDASTVTFVLAFLLVGLGTMRVDAEEMAEEEERISSSNTHTREDGPPSSSSRRGGKRSSRWPSRTLLCIAVAAIAVLAALPMTTSSDRSPSLNERTLEELTSSRSNIIRAFGNGQGQVPVLQGPAAPDAVVALILSIIAAVGCKVCHSDLLDMQAEEEEKHCLQKNMKHQQKVQPETTASPQSPESGESHSAAFDLPMVLRVALACAVVGNVVLLVWALESAQMPLIVPAARHLGLGLAVRLSVPFASDEVTVLSLGIFFLLGLVAFCIDFHNFQQEDRAKGEACSSRETGKKMAATTCSDKTVKDLSWSQYLSMNWRMVSCIVLLVSMFAAAAPAALEAVM